MSTCLKYIYGSILIQLYCNRIPEVGFHSGRHLRRILGIGLVDRPLLRRLDRASDSPERAKKGTREVYFSDTGTISVDLYDRDRLLAEDTLEGPAIIEQMDTTIVLPRNTHVEVEEYGNLIITL